MGATLQGCPLYAIVDVDVCARAGRAPLDVARAFLAAGVQCLQLRAKTWESGAFLEWAAAVQELAVQAGALVIINDRADVAAMAGAGGVHVGQEDVPPADARLVVGPLAVVGLSTHTDKQLQAGVLEPVSYLAIGPVFGTATKQTGYPPRGLDLVRHAVDVAGAHGLPVVAIGGITLETAPQVIAAGAASVAIITDLMAGDPEQRARAFLSTLA